MTRISNVLDALDFSDEEIAERTRLRLERVREILNGAPVNQSELRALSAGLKIPLKTFAVGTAAVSRRDKLGLLFREAKLEKSRGYEGTIENVIAFIEGALEILPPRTSLPEWLKTYDLEEESYSEAYRLAGQFREQFYPRNLEEPAFDLPQVLSDDASIIISKLKHARYEGASVIAGGYCFIVFSPRFPGRMLFTLAHELGHILAHHPEGGIAVFDKPTQIGGIKRKSKSEAFADAFASILLLPDQGVGITLKKIRDLYKIETDEVGDVEILVLARMYGVSFEVAARRCEDLDLLPTGGARSLYEYLVKNHGSPERRADELELPARNIPEFPSTSSNLLNFLIEKVASGQVSIGWATDRLGLSVDEIYTWHARVGDSERRH